MRYGDCAENIIRMMKKADRPSGPLLQRPELFEDLIPFYRAFCMLSGSRNINGRIPLSEILIYADRHGVLDVDSFAHLVQALDRHSAEISKEIGHGSNRNS